MHRRPAWQLYFFSFFLLLVGTGIRSGILVDTSFLPRFVILASLLLITWLILLKRNSLPPFGFYEWAFLLFYLWSILSSAWAIVPSEAILQSQLIFLALIAFLVLSALVAEYPFFESIFIRILILAVVFSFFLAARTMIILDYFDPYKIISISAHKNLYSGYLLLSLAFTLRGYSLFTGCWKYVSGAVTCCTLFCIIILQSRAAYLGVSLALFSTFLIFLLSYNSLLTRRNIMITAASLGILVAAALLFHVSLHKTRYQHFLLNLTGWHAISSSDEERPEGDTQAYPDTLELTRMPVFDFARSCYNSDDIRTIFWKKSIPLFLSHPLKGIGAGNWKVAVPSVPLPENPDHTLRNHTYSHPHNEAISMATELGIIGLLLAVVVFLAPPARIFYRIIRNPGKPPAGSVPYLSFILGFYLYSMFDFPLKRVEHNILLFAAMAFLVRLTPSPPLRYQMSTPLLRKTICSLIPLVLLGSIVIASVRIVGEYYTLQLFRSNRDNVVDAIRYCKKAENVFYRLTPNTLPVAWFEGVAWYRLGDLREAESAFARALTISPFEVRVLNDYGITLYRLGNKEKALSLLQQSIYLDRHFDDAKFNLAAICFYSGRAGEARELVRSCRDSEKKEIFLHELNDPGK